MKLWSVVLAVAAVFLFCGAAYCDEDVEMFGPHFFDLSGKIGVAGNVSAAMPKEDGDPTVFLGGYLSYDILNCFGVGIESGWARWTQRDNGVDYGNLNMIPLFGDIFVKLPFKVEGFKVVPYGVVGAGVLFWDFEESSLVRDSGVTISIDPAFGLKFGGGIDFFVTKNIAIFGEASFIWSDADATASAGGSVASATLDTDLWLLGGGVKYVF